jgi:hypothetical protein
MMPNTITIRTSGAPMNVRVSGREEIKMDDSIKDMEKEKYAEETVLNEDDIEEVLFIKK